MGELPDDHKEKLSTKVHRLEACKDLVELLEEIIEEQDPAFQLLGFSITEGALQTIVYLLGIGISLTLVFMAKAEIEIALEA